MNIQNTFYNCLLFNVVFPDTFKVDINVVAPFNLVVDDTFKIPLIEVELHKTLFLPFIKIPYVFEPDCNNKLVFVFGVMLKMKTKLH